jgi:hypothetical protein
MNNVISYNQVISIDIGNIVKRKKEDGTNLEQQKKILIFSYHLSCIRVNSKVIINK